MSSEHGQASIEWTGLLLLVTVAFSVALSFAPGGEDPSLARTVARRLVCAVRGACGADALGAATARDAGAAPTPATTSSAGGRRPSLTAPVAQTRFRSGAGSAARVGARAGSRALHGVKFVAKRAWILCLGWARYGYERAHPGGAVMGRGIPAGEALKIANDCLNPFDFIFGS